MIYDRFIALLAFQLWKTLPQLHVLLKKWMGAAQNWGAFILKFLTGSEDILVYFVTCVNKCIKENVTDVTSYLYMLIVTVTAKMSCYSDMNNHFTVTNTVL